MGTHLHHGYQIMLDGYQRNLDAPVRQGKTWLTERTFVRLVSGACHDLRYPAGIPGRLREGRGRSHRRRPEELRLLQYLRGCLARQAVRADRRREELRVRARGRPGRGSLRLARLLARPERARARRRGGIHAADADRHGKPAAQRLGRRGRGGYRRRDGPGGRAARAPHPAARGARLPVRARADRPCCSSRQPKVWTPCTAGPRSARPRDRPCTEGISHDHDEGTGGRPGGRAERVRLPRVLPRGVPLQPGRVLRLRRPGPPADT